MIDLVGALKNKQLEQITPKSITTVLFYESIMCKELVEEAFRFEGIPTPTLLTNTDELIKKHVRESSIEVVIVELNKSDNVIKDMERIGHYLPNTASVIVIGGEDAISTIRGLKNMGYYYLFWPITKSELTEFVKNVYANRNRNYGLGQKRLAKRIAVCGTKGGVGASLIAAGIAQELTESRNSSCVLIDQDVRGGSLDILLSLNDFSRRVVPQSFLLGDVDEQLALTLSTRINPLLSLLSIDSSNYSDEELRVMVSKLSSHLAPTTNFLVEDYSSFGFTKYRADKFAQDLDVIVIVLIPTIESVREADKLIKYVAEVNLSSRIITVLNNSRPEKHAVLLKRDIERFLAVNIDVECPYDAKMNIDILRGNRITNRKLAISKSVDLISSIILGEKKESVSYFPWCFRKV